MAFCAGDLSSEPGESVSYTGLEPSISESRRSWSPWSAVAAGGVFASSAWTGGLEEALSSGEPLGEPIEGVDGESASTGGLEASGSATGAGLPSGEMKGLRNAGLTAASGGVLTFDLFALLPMVVR